MKWLVIFDNVSDASILKQYWPDVSRGSVIVTCRSPEIARQFSKKRLHVDSFDPSVGSEFLLSLAVEHYPPRMREAELAAVISEAVGNHPLALDMIGCHMRSCGKSMEHFIRDHPNFERDFIFRPDLVCGLESANEGLVSDVFALNSGNVIPMDSHSRLLICMLAFLDPDGAPLDLFTGHTRETMLVILISFHLRHSFFTDTVEGSVTGQTMPKTFATWMRSSRIRLRIHTCE